MTFDEFLAKTHGADQYSKHFLENIFNCQCYNCKNVKARIHSGYKDWHSFLSCSLYRDYDQKHNYFTQKARGIAALSQMTHYDPALDSESFCFPEPSSTFVIQDESQIPPVVAMVATNFVDVMVRPCPPSPEHGFVESEPFTFKRFGNNVEEIDKANKSEKLEEKIRRLWKEATAIYHDSELLIMSLLSARSSAVWIPESGILSLGKGHDGATSGHDSISLPTLATPIAGSTRAAATVGDDDHAYFEIIYPPVSQYYGGPGSMVNCLTLKLAGQSTASHAYLVQARSGPAAPATTEYIPSAVKVQKVIRPVDDLVEWKKIVLAEKDTPGLVVWGPGSTLAAHAAVHCLAHRIPYLTRDTEPQIGEVLDPPPVQQYGFDKKEYQFGLELSAKVPSIIIGLRAAVAIIHNMAALRTSPHWSRLLGFAASVFFRAAAMACLGEARHSKEINSDMNREAIYSKGLRMSGRALADSLAYAASLFPRAIWPGGYGGLPWFHSATKAMKFYDVMTACDPSKVIEVANELLNCEHNNGWLFSKFCEKGFMDTAAKYPSSAMAASGMILYDVLTYDTSLIVKRHTTQRKKKLAPTLKLNGVARYDDGSVILTVDGWEWEDLQFPVHQPLIEEFLAHV